VVNSGVSTTWTVCRESDSALHQDYFPHAAGDVGSGEFEPFNPLKGFEFDDDQPDMLFKCFLHLWPGNFQQDYNRLLAKHNKLFPGELITLNDWVVFLGLVIGAVQYAERGRHLFRSQAVRGIRPQPNFSTYMTEAKFERIKKVAHVVFNSTTTSEISDPWYQFRGGVVRFNENRSRTVAYTKDYRKWCTICQRSSNSRDHRKSSYFCKACGTNITLCKKNPDCLTAHIAEVSNISSSLPPPITSPVNTTPPPPIQPRNNKRSHHLSSLFVTPHTEKYQKHTKVS
jgi:hypothetical protein